MQEKAASEIENKRSKWHLLLVATRWLWFVIVLGVLFLNLKLYAPSPLAEDVTQTPPSLLKQLAANRASLDAGAGPRMQSLFPEGYYFCYVLHGLSWVELAMRDPSHKQQAIEEATDCLSKLESPKGKAPFPKSLPPDHGMFYSAWKCHLRAGIAYLQQGKDKQQLSKLRLECDAIARTLAQSTTPYPPSYPRASWPCDTLPGIHALQTYDQITAENRYEKAIQKWLVDIQQRLDPETGLLSHTADLPDGKPSAYARATSQVIILRFLPDIDAAFASEQYERFREHFLTTFLGIPCLLEYPSGIEGRGDVDSGPLIFGRSLSATVFMIGLAQIYGDQSIAYAIAQTGEVVGLPWTYRGRKQYAFGVLPVGNIMVCYAYVARPWYRANEHYPSQMAPLSWAWRLPVHVLSLLFLLPYLYAYWRNRRQPTEVDSQE